MEQIFSELAQKSYKSIANFISGR